jgi:outer membrane protein OmpA-like peptidoglycan-associated protein
MNIKALLSTLLFLAFGAFAFWWWGNKKKDCNCGSTPAIANNGGTVAAESGLPLSFNWGNADAITGSEFAGYKKTQVNNLGPSDTLQITTWYYEGEANGEQLALQRAEKIKALFPEAAPGRYKVVTEKRTGNDKYKKEKFEAASFSVLQNKNSLVKKQGNRVLIYFASNSSAKQLEKEVDDYLATVATDMKTDSSIRVNLVGYTDNVGADDKNLALSKNRAEFVKNALLGKGANPAKLSSEGKGEADPIASNDNDEGRKQNRRVELMISNQ